jgi:hypothetical protein
VISELFQLTSDHFPDEAGVPLYAGGEKMNLEN